MSRLEFTRNQKLALVAIIGLIAIAVSIKLARNAGSASYYGVVLKEPGQGGDGVDVVTSDSDSAYSPSKRAGKVVFQVAGCVKSPGVYTLPTGSRIIDGINTAGGAKADADLESLNLAATIEDGSKIYVPPTAASSASSAPRPTSAPAGKTRKSSSRSSAVVKLRNPGDGVVHINSADANELQRLPGVGPSTAQRIMEYRAQVGHFTRVDQLDDVKGIGPSKLEKMRPFIAL
jgi:competence protein ComEA